MLGGLCNSIGWLVLIGAVMGVAERVRPAHPAQRLLRSGFVTDLIYWLTPYFLYRPFAPRPLAAAVEWTTKSLTGAPQIGFAFVAHLSPWSQAAAAFVIADFLSYWGHRAMHGRALWPFHAIHHGSTEIDWLSTIRNHPVNVVIQRFVLTAPLLLMGFPVAAILATAPFAAIYNIFAHANIAWRFGPLSRVLVSPSLHRWHHTPSEGCDRNFGEVLAIWDVMFGTFHLPETDPQRFGLDDGPPADVVGQTLWPVEYFLAPRRRLAPAQL